MNSYNLYNDAVTGRVAQFVKRSDHMHIPFAVDNTDYQKFKTDLQAGAELRDSDGNVMTASQIQEFLATLT